MQEIVLCLIVFNFELLDVLLNVFISRCAVERLFQALIFLSSPCNIYHAFLEFAQSLFQF